MLRLTKFEYHRPKSVTEALELMTHFVESGKCARFIAGGTDLLPNIKHEVTSPSHVISLRDTNLSGITEETDDRGWLLRIGATTTLHAVAASTVVQERFPALAQACAGVGGPQLRHMGTIGGNICLDTRCRYINQTAFWRQSLGYCLKKDGDRCHVIPGGKRCVAAFSADAGVALAVLDAEIEVASASLACKANRSITPKQLYKADGVNHKTLHPTELVQSVVLRDAPSPDGEQKSNSGFTKLTTRASIDFGLASLAISLKRRGNCQITNLLVAAGALAARPRLLQLTSEFRDCRLDDGLVDRLGGVVSSRCKPLGNINADAAWRGRMLGVMTKEILGRFVH